MARSCCLLDSLQESYFLSTFVSEDGQQKFDRMDGLRSLRDAWMC
jgi:hypothetical protein